MSESPPLSDRSPGRGDEREGVRRLSVMHFLAALMGMLITMPFVDQLEYGRLMEAVALSIVLLTAVLAIGGRRATLAIAVALVTPALLAIWFGHFLPEHMSREVTLVAGMVFVAFVMANLMRFMIRAPWVNSEVLCAAVATYFMLGIFWAFVYALLGILTPHAFEFMIPQEPHRQLTRFEAVYFSFSTLTTVAYGDIVPLSNVARMLTNLEAATGVFYMALVISRLVSLYSSRPPE